jgi:hypothetical protein
MKLQLTIFFLLFLALAFSQEDNEIVKMKPLEMQKIPIKPKVENEHQKYRDSLLNALKNDKYCLDLISEYNDLCCEVQYKVWEAKEKIKQLNKDIQNLGYYYELHLDFFGYFDFGCCKKYSILMFALGHEYGIDVIISIVKKEKSVFNEDGTSGETIYYDDIKRMPEF